MTQFACKCLNVVIKCDAAHAEALELEKLGISTAEQRDPFFREQLCLFAKADVQLAQEGLIERQCNKSADKWIIFSCLNCQVQTHAVNQDGRASKYLVKSCCAVSPQMLINSTKYDKYSEVFKILIEDREEHDKLKLPLCPPDKMQSAVGNLSRQLTKALQTQLEAVEEEIQAFRDKKYAEFECFREKAHRDHKILTSIVNVRNDGKEEGMSWSPTEAVPLSPQGSAFSSLPQSRRRLSSFKGQVKIKQPLKPALVIAAGKEDSLDSEGIFDLEGMDSETPPNNGGNSEYYSDSDDSTSRDEGIHVRRGHKSTPSASRHSILAKSLPMNMPTFPVGHEMSHEDFDDEEEPADIAASIKALARSVHADVFGELPRPRFSTQI